MKPQLLRRAFFIMFSVTIVSLNIRTLISFDVYTLIHTYTITFLNYKYHFNIIFSKVFSLINALTKPKLSYPSDNSRSFALEILG